MKKLLAFSLFTLVTVLGALAAEKPIVSTASDRTGNSITIYNNNFGLVVDSRKLALPSGSFLLKWTDVPSGMNPTSAHLREASGIRVLEQFFEPASLTPQHLLESFAGQTLTMVRSVVENNQPVEKSFPATLLSARDGTVWRLDDKIVTNPPYLYLIYPSFPSHLTSQPTLNLRLESRSAKSYALDMLYLTNGLDWRADYLFQTNPDASQTGLTCWASINNQSGALFRDATLTLVAGEPHAASRPRPMPMMAMEARAAQAQMAVEEQPAFEYHVYSVPGTYSLAQGETREIPLFSAASVPVKKYLEFESAPGMLGSRLEGEQPPQSASVVVEFQNNKESNLGIPLPAGTVRIFQEGEGSAPLYLGEDSIRHTPAGQTVRLIVGAAFDVVARRTQTDFRQIARNIYEMAYEIKVQNAKKQPVEVRITESFPGDWTILESSIKWEKVSSSQARFLVRVAAGGENVLTYRVRVKY